MFPPVNGTVHHIQLSGSLCHPVCFLGHLGSVEGPWDPEGFGSRIGAEPSALGQRTTILCPKPAVVRREHSLQREAQTLSLDEGSLNYHVIKDMSAPVLHT